MACRKGYGTISAQRRAISTPTAGPLFLYRYRAELDVSIFYCSAVVLEGDVAPGGAAPVALSIGGQEELAGLDVRLPASAVDLVLQQLFSV